jgi:glycine/D-amino acid oxidase-like deaminating enzyme/nitrite reductase/ring-hydroxylating ferredoxin subunit
MRKEAVWKGENKDDYPKAGGKESCEVAIIGGGITGLTTGYLLAQAGVKSIIYEAQFIGNGTSGSSTGNLYATVDEMYHKIAEKFNEDTAGTIAESRMAALAKINSIISSAHIECEYVETSFYLLAETSDQVDKVKKEYEACATAGIEANYKENLPEYPGQVEGVLEVPAQAQFNPKKYLKALAKLYVEAGGQIMSNSAVRNIDGGEKNKPFILSGEGFECHAKKVVHATHSPKGISILHTLLGPYREYVLAAKLKTPFKEGIYWTRQGNHHYSVRIYKKDGAYYLFCLGEPHKVGQADDNKEYLDRIESYLRTHFDVGTIEYTWGAQHYKSADKVPYIGRMPGEDRIFVGTGYSTDGLVYGTVAAMLFADLIGGKSNDSEKIYDPGRTNPVNSAKRFIKENINVAGQLIKDYPFKGEVGELNEIEPGQGKLIKIEGNNYAAYRNYDGKTVVTSAICPHLGCVVHWNNSEKSWDCPCHGSRFAPDGEVLEGPSYEGLKKMDN